MNAFSHEPRLARVVSSTTSAGDHGFRHVASAGADYLAEVAKRAIANNRGKSSDPTLSAEIREKAKQAAEGIIAICLKNGILEVADVR